MHDTPAYDGVSSYQVYLQKVERFRRYRPDKKQRMKFQLNIRCDLDREHDNPVFSEVYTLAYDDPPSD